MTDRFSTTRGRSGVVYSAGHDVRPRDAAIPMQPHRAPYRAVVVNTYVSDTDGRSYRQKSWQVTCDVILCRTGHRMNHVPVQQPAWGEHDARPWIPRESTRVISQNTALNVDVLRTARGNFVGGVTPLDDLDGDVVLVDFIEGSFRHPIIRGAIPHPQTKRLVYEGPGHTDGAGGEDDRGKVYRREAYARHAGVEARVSGVGDVLLDTVAATDDRTEQDTSGASGHVRVRVKGSQRLTVEMDGTDALEVWKDGSQVRIDLGEGAAQRIPLGDDQVAAFDAFRSALTTWIALVKTGIEAGGGGLVNTAFETAITQLGTDLSNALSDLAKVKKT